MPAKNVKKNKTDSIIEVLSKFSPETIDDAIDEARALLSPTEKKEFDEKLKIARARIDRKASIEMWMRTPNGKPIILTTLQRFILDFVDIAWEYGLIPVVNGPMGIGKTILSVGIVATEIGRNQNIRTQIICASDDGAQERGGMVANILLSRDYKKVYPHIEKDSKKNWNAHKINVKRTVMWDDEEIADIGGAPTSINATMTSYGVTSAGLGSRSERSIFDDIPTYENSIKSPGEGKHISEMLSLKWLSRRESPVGISDSDYDPSKDPWRGLFINTPWHENDCVFHRRKFPNFATVVIGVNEDFTAYNVEIWNMPKEAVDRLRRFYSVCGHCGDAARLHGNDGCRGDRCSIDATSNPKHKFVEMPGYNVYLDYPAHHTMTVNLSRPAQWYRNMAAESIREFNQKYRCIVYSDQERAFPAFSNTLVEDRKPNGDWMYRVNWDNLVINRNGKQTVVGARGWIDSRDVVKGWKFAAVDLSGVGRRGTVITVGSIFPNQERLVEEVVVGALAGNEITDQIDDLHRRHPDIINIWVEDAGQQALFISELTKHKERYAWWWKISPFKTHAKNKNDRIIGVLGMAQTFANKGIKIPNSTLQSNHPAPGSPGYEDGCPCGICCLIRDCKSQMRGVKIDSDFIMSLWMWHSSMPAQLEMPRGVAPGGIDYANDGFDLMKSAYDPDWSVLSTDAEAILPAPLAKAHTPAINFDHTKDDTVKEEIAKDKAEGNDSGEVAEQLVKPQPRRSAWKSIF